MTLYMHVCPTCQIEFQRVHPDSVCCSRRCARILGMRKRLGFI